MTKLATRLDFNPVDTKLQEQATRSADCWGCGAVKDPDKILCPSCFEGCKEFEVHGIRPFKTFTGSFFNWLKFEKPMIRRALC
jgi:uncharacterized OB-fold protein